MNTKAESMRKQIEEIQRKNDAFLAARIPGYDPERAKATREKLRSSMEKQKTTAPVSVDEIRKHFRQLRKK